MAAEGLESLYPLEDFAVMGLVEVLPHVLQIRAKMTAIVERVIAEQPRVLVTIDSPAFSLRISKRLKGRGPALVHYVAPSVWAWKPWRAREVAGFLDCLLTLLPFEPPYFEAHGLKSVFVGHPAVEAPKGVPAEPAPQAGDQGPLLCLLPGSRRGEITRLLPVFKAAVARLHGRFPGLRCSIATLPSQAALVRAESRNWPVPLTVVEGDAAKRAAFAAAQVALAASGTVAVELAVAGLPAVIAYRTNPLTAEIVKRLIKVRFASIPNLLLDRQAQPELIQWDCTPDAIAAALTPLLEDPAARAAQLEAYRQVVGLLTLEDGRSPSERAAEEVLALC